MGLVNRVVPADQVFSHAMDMAGTIASKSSGTIKFGKEAFYRQLEMPVAEAYDYAAEIMTENMLTRDAEEGIGAFLQKRPPRWGKAD
jgi:enoyl-CoA hydratase/carnithine racemase